MYKVMVENHNREFPVPKFVAEFPTRAEAEEYLEDHRDKFIYEYDNPNEIIIRKKYIFFIKEENN